MSNLKPAVQAISDNLKKDATFAEDGSPVLAGDAYERTLPDGLTVDIVKAVQKHNNQFIQGATNAFGELSVVNMKKDKELAVTSTSVKIVDDKLDLRINREQEVSDGKGGRQTVVGAVSAKYRTTAHLNPVKKNIRTLAEEALVK